MLNYSPSSVRVHFAPVPAWGRDPAARPFIKTIQERVARFYGLRFNDMVSARRAREVAWPRQTAMYIAKRLTLRSLPEIGRRFGNRDHTTVIHAIKQVEKRRAADPELDAEIKLLERDLTQ